MQIYDIIFVLLFFILTYTVFNRLIGFSRMASQVATFIVFAGAVGGFYLFYEKVYKKKIMEDIKNENKL